MIAKVVMAALLSCDTGLAALFTPSHARLGSYQICTTATSLGELVEESKSQKVENVARGEESNGPGVEGVAFGKIESLEALDAFGRAGPYDRAALARLYGGMRVKVVRGWRTRGDAIESVTLISPYPNVSLTRIQPGTMVLISQWRRGPTFH